MAARDDTTESSGTPLGMRNALKKATTEMLVLFFLRQKPMYTYQIAREVERVSSGALTYNTMYLAVYRLQANGYIYEAQKSIEDGRARIYLAPTPEGLTYYEALRAEYAAFIGTLDAILAQDGALYPKEADDV